MSERPRPSDHDPSSEITTEQKQALIARIREIAPFTGQSIDRFGVFYTHFFQDDRDVLVYIPEPSGAKLDGRLVDERVQLIQYVPEEPVTETTTVHITSYTVSETTLESEFHAEIRVFDTMTGVQASPMRGEETTKLVKAYAKEWELNTSPITETHLRDANALLDSLNPNQIV